MKPKNIPLSPVGAGSLLAAFAIVCLTVFALLSLTTAHREQQLSDSAHRAVSGYYEADFRAQEIFARLRTGELPPQVTRLDHLYTYRIPVCGHSCLEIALEQTGSGWNILRWQLSAEPPEETAQPLEVWTGQEDTP